MKKESEKQSIQIIQVSAMVALTLIVGIAALFCIKKYDVHAEETGSSSVSGYILIGSCKNVMSQSVLWYAPGGASSYCTYKLPNGSYAVIAKGDDFGGVQSFSTYAEIVGTSGSSTNTGNFILKNDGYYAVDGFYLSADSLKLCIPKFPSAEKAIQYATGLIDITEADNYNDIKDSVTSYNSAVPAPDKLYIQSLSSVSVTSVWQYTDSSVDLEGMTYEVKVEHYYMTTSLLASIAKGASGKEGEKILNVSATIDSMQRMIVKDTVEGYIENPTKLLADQLLVSEDVEKKTGQMQYTNMLVSSPTDYSGKFAASGNAFFTGATSAHQAEYCGTQITVTPYKEIDGRMVKGNVCVARRFTSDILNNIGGSSYTQIGQDDAGNEFISKSNAQDGNGNDISLIKDNTDLSDVNADSVIKYIRDGFGILGNNGILEMSKTFFSEVPWYIWSLIAMIIGVNIVVILFKILRGM